MYRERIRPAGTHADLDDQLALGDRTLSELLVAGGGGHLSGQTSAILDTERRVVIYPHQKEKSSLPLKQETLDTATRHYDRLREFGMSIVSFTFENTAENTSDSNPGVALIGVSDAVATELSTTKAEITSESAERYIRQPILKYLDWCIEKSQPVLHTTLFNEESYAQHNSGAVFMHKPTPDLTIPIGPAQVFFMRSYVEDKDRFLNRLSSE